MKIFQHNPFSLLSVVRAVGIMAVRVSNGVFSTVEAEIVFQMQGLWPIAKAMRIYKFCPMSADHAEPEPGRTCQR